MRAGEKIALEAMKKEFVRLSRAADRAKSEADEHMNVGSEMIAIHNEFAEIVKSKATGPEVVEKLDVLKKRKDRADKVVKKNLVKLLDKQYEAESARDNLGTEIQMAEFRYSRA